MKRLLTLVAILTASIVGVSKAQNIQLHYDFGKHIYKNEKDRPALTTTVENFSFDKWGQTFFFVDFTHNNNGIQGAYFEIARDLRFWNMPISIHAEYNGGTMVNDAYIGGLSYQWFSRDGAKFLSLAMMYRHDRKADKPHNMQMTTTWMWNSWNRLFTVNGFADLWTSSVDGRKSNLVFVAEPQFWINLNQYVWASDGFNLSLGSEVRCYYNFNLPDKFHVYPTLAVKWTFR